VRVFFIINRGRRASGVPRRLIAGFHSVLEGCSEEHRIEESGAVSETPRLVREALDGGFDTLWIGGGDGTIHHVLNASLENGMAYGVVPMGTVNAFARATGIPLEPLAAARYLAGATPVPAALGRVNGRHFLCFASVGFDAAVVHDVSAGSKLRLGKLAYVAHGVGAVFRQARLARFAMEAHGPDGAVTRDAGHSLIASNIRNYAGMDLFPAAAPHTATLELALFRSAGPGPLLVHAARGFAGLDTSRGGATTGRLQASQVRLVADRPLYLQLDGDPVVVDDPCDLRFECLPGAVRVLLRE
jgi:YegS/Rv2252/BmrU family lipid kinase